MVSGSFFEACQAGNVEQVLEQLSQAEPIQLDERDEHGMTGLAYAARNGHHEVVNQLLSRGATFSPELEQGHGRAAPNGQHDFPSEAGQYSDLQYQDGHYQPAFPYDPQHQHGKAPAHPSNPSGHGRKDSNFNLPPPDVARQIPCRFFPNCKYGDKCMFAHPIMSMSGNAGPQLDGPQSPSSHQSPMQPIFYQPMPSGYPYPGPYGAGPHPSFYPGMPPLDSIPQQPYGYSNFPPGPMIQPQFQHLPYIQEQHPPQDQQEQHQHHNEGSPDSPSNEAAQSGQEPLSSTSETLEGKLQQSLALTDNNDADADQNSRRHDDSAVAGQPTTDSTPAIDDAGAPTTNGTSHTPSADSPADGQPTPRRQSFSSFLHHHAVPFQPLQQQQPSEMAMMPVMMPPMGQYAPRMGGKNRKLPNGIGNGYMGSKRNQGDRPPCTFFAGGRCRFGDECRFPHILSDGTDARPIQAEQRQIHAAQYGNANGYVNGRSAFTRPNGQFDNSVPASTPTGPQADKKAAAAAAAAATAVPDASVSVTNGQTQDVTGTQQTSPPPKGANVVPSGPTSMTTNAPVVRSAPSKTSTQSNGGPSNGPRSHQNGGHHQGKKHAQQHHQAAQRIPTGNDFPALAVSAPTSNGTSTAAASSAETTGTSVPKPAANGSEVSSTPATSNGHPGQKINFSAILSAPAPVRAKEVAESEADTATSVATASDEQSRSEEKDATSKATQHVTPPKEASKARSKDGKLRKDHASGTTANKASVPVTSNGHAAQQQDGDDDFQLVNRSRGTAKRSAGTHISTETGDSYAPQARAVIA